LAHDKTTVVGREYVHFVGFAIPFVTNIGITMREKRIEAMEIGRAHV
jgi:hypothetical protein